ncbi:MAG: hypothetical protein ACOC7U_03595 [Spirochaetota bacterium]
MGEQETNLDPEIAELLGIEEEEKESFLEKPEAPPRAVPKTQLQKINIQKLLSDKSLYSSIIKQAGSCGKKLHEILSKFFKAEEKDEKSMYREKLTPAYWNMVGSLVEGFFDAPSEKKQALLRYGLLNPSFLNDTQKNILIELNTETSTDQEIYFVDEWLSMVGNGKIKQSAVDETLKDKKKSRTALKSKMERKQGSREAELANLRQKLEQHQAVEKSLSSSLSLILDHQKMPGYGDMAAPYTPEQKKALVQIQDIAKELLKSDKEISGAYSTLESLDQEISSIKEKGAEEPAEIDTRVIKGEFSSLRQMIKMTVGRQGNHFPFLVQAYMPKSNRDVCTKKKLLQVLAELEGIDPGIFLRTFKREEHRILPYFIIVPSYGDYGICWEPFDRMNKATSRGRVSLPMFPRNLKQAVLYALGDMRWQIAKEKALHYWMEEGLTGHYYDYIQTNKIKGDLKESFIQDYIQWMTYESQGMQKLHRDVRAIFWRYIPFPQKIKDNLKNRGFYYSELYRRDQNRSISRGY